MGFEFLDFVGLFDDVGVGVVVFENGDRMLKWLELQRRKNLRSAAPHSMEKRKKRGHIRKNGF